MIRLRSACCDRSRPKSRWVRHVSWFALLCSTAAIAQPFGNLPGYRAVELGGGEPGDHGRVVREIGDIDGDGFTDFAVGSPSSSYAERANVGKTFVVYGSREPMPMSLRSLEPEQGGDGSRGFVVVNPVAHGFIQAGSTIGYLAPLGDFDGDGFDDFGLADRAQSDGAPWSGVLYVFFGGPRAPGAPPFPARVDLLLAAQGAYGSRLLRVSGGSTGGFASALSRAGDFNADGLADIAVGHVGQFADDSGAVQIHFGRRARTIGMPDLVLRGEPSPIEHADFGANGIIGGHDFNGDGVSDVQVCSRLSTLAPFGFSCYVVFGGNVAALGTEFRVGRLRAAQGGDGALGFVVNGGPNYGLGFADRILGETDLNHDGFVDLAYGSAFFEPAGGGADDDFGRVSVLYGRNRFAAEYDLLRLDPAFGGDGSDGFVLDGPPSPRAELGAALARAGDVNGDGVDDIAISGGAAYNFEGVRGRVYIVFGRRAASSQAFPPRTVLTPVVVASGAAATIDGTADFTRFGASLGALADLNADGRDELLIGASTARVDGFRVGMAVLYVSIAPQGGPGSATAVTALDGVNRALLALALALAAAVALRGVRPTH